MIISDKFVYIHKPKTGGTFVTDALLKLYEGKWNWLVHARLAWLKVVHFKNHLGTLSLTANKHGGCLDIPKGHQNKVIVTTIRNPLDYYVSQYEFGWWKRKEWHSYYKSLNDFPSRFPDFPNLSFEKFMELMPMAFNKPPHHNFNDPTTLGWLTVEFVNNYFYRPDVVLSNINTDNYVQSGTYKMDMFPVHFIFTHKLNQQLYTFLLGQGYPEEDIRFIVTKPKMLPQGKGRSANQKWEQYYTPELKKLVREKDWFLFELFPEFEAL